MVSDSEVQKHLSCIVSGSDLKKKHGFFVLISGPDFKTHFGTVFGPTIQKMCFVWVFGPDFQKHLIFNGLGFRMSTTLCLVVVFLPHIPDHVFFSMIYDAGLKHRRANLKKG